MKLPGMYFSSEANLKRPRVASTFRVICNPEHELSAGMMGCGLLLRRDCFTQRQNLRHDWLDLSRVDQVRDLGEVFGIRVNGNCRSTNPAFLKLDPVGSRHQ